MCNGFALGESAKTWLHTETYNSGIVKELPGMSSDGFAPALTFWRVSMASILALDVKWSSKMLDATLVGRRARSAMLKPLPEVARLCYFCQISFSHFDFNAQHHAHC